MSYNKNDSRYNVLNIKLDLARAQTKELQTHLESFIDKISLEINTAAEEKLPANHIAEINSQLDTFLALLMEKWPKINDIGAQNTEDNSYHGKLPEGQKELISDMSELVQRMGKVESDLVLVLNRQQTDEGIISTAQTQIFRIEEDLKTITKEKQYSDKDYNSKFELLNNRVMVLEEDESLSCLQKQFHEKLTDSDVKEHGTRLNTIQDLIQNLQMNCSEIDNVVQKQSDEVQTLKKSISDINHCQNTQESISDNLSRRVETVMDRVVMSKEEAKYERDELKKRLSTFDIRIQADVMKLNSLFNQVCHMVSTKVNPLCRLQTILNKHRATLKHENIFHSQMKSVSSQVNNLLPRIQQLELGTRNSSVGFTAYLHSQIKVAKGSKLIFSDVRYNCGNHYSGSTGMFTAVREGVYIAAVTLSQSSVGTMDVQIIKHSVSNAVIKVVCKAETTYNCGNSCGIGIASMKVGDVLFVKVKDAQENVCLSGFSSFSCVLIG